MEAITQASDNKLLLLGLDKKGDIPSLKNFVNVVLTLTNPKLIVAREHLDKLNPRQQAFFQKPREKFEQSDQVWFENKPLGVNKFSTIMKQISIGAGLSKKYTNHCVRATAITLWSDSCVPARHIMSISCHTNEQSLASYNRRPSTSQLKNCSDILSHALQKGRAPAQTATAGTSFPNPPSSSLKFLKILPFKKFSTAVILARHRCSFYHRMRRGSTATLTML